MLTREELNKTIDELNIDRKATFAEFIDKLFRGKFIEIYLGDAYEEVSVDQISISYPTVFSGKVEGAYKEVLVINGGFVDRRTKKISLGKFVFINERAIRGLSLVEDGCVFDDMFLRSRDAVEIKNSFSDK